MRVLEVDREPFDVLPYLDAAGPGIVERRDLPLHRGRVDALPPGLDALVAAADLQGREVPAGGPPRLLGEALAERLEALADPLGGSPRIPPLDRTGVLLGGDLYTVPAADRRGGTGDARAVWLALAARARWVAGVAGNHDVLGRDPRERAAFARRGGVNLLDGDVRVLDGLRVGGVGGIVGDPRKNERRHAEDFLALVERVVAERLDVLVLHEGPDLPSLGLRGNEGLRETLELLADALRPAPPPVVVCGHTWWHLPLAELGSDVQVLKVNARAVVLTM